MVLVMRGQWHFWTFSTFTISPYYTGYWASLEYICSMEDQSGMLTCADIEPTIFNEFKCKENFTAEVLDPNYMPESNGSCVNYNQYYTECRSDGPNPFQEAISFDNIASAWIAIFQVHVCWAGLPSMFALLYEQYLYHKFVQQTSCQN